MIRIACTGVPSGGKSTTSSHIYSELKVRKYTANLLQETARDAKQHGFALDEAAGADVQNWILGSQIREEMEWLRDPAQLMVLDRAVPDSVPFVRINPNIDPRHRALVEDMAFLYCVVYPYDLLFYHPPFATIENDGVRSTSVTWQSKLDEAFRQVLTEIRPKPEIVYLDDMDKRDRRDQAWAATVDFLKRKGVWKSI